MAAESYSTACPRCGAPLQPVALDPQTAPWLCPSPPEQGGPGCANGFWAAELSEDARGMYRHHHRDWGHGLGAMGIRDKVLGEQIAAAQRGTSLREDQIYLAPADVLTGALRFARSEKFIDAVKAELERRAAK